MRYSEIINSISKNYHEKLNKDASLFNLHSIFETVTPPQYRNILNNISHTAIPINELVIGEFYAPIGLITEYSKLTIYSTLEKYKLIKIARSILTQNLTFEKPDGTITDPFINDFENNEISMQTLVFKDLTDRSHTEIYLGLQDLIVKTVIR